MLSHIGPSPALCGGPSPDPCGDRSTARKGSRVFRVCAEFWPCGDRGSVCQVLQTSEVSQFPCLAAMAQLISLRLLLAFLLAACGRGRAPVGFVQHLPAIKTLQGRMGEMAKKARRLQTGLDQECMTKCPGLLFMMTDLMSGMQTNPPAGDNASDATAGFDALASMMGAMFSAMCKHSAAMTCMVTECAAPTNGDSGEIGVESLEQFMPCLCDACPGFVDLFTSLGSTAALLENNTNITEAEGILLAQKGFFVCCARWALKP